MTRRLRRIGRGAADVVGVIVEHATIGTIGARPRFAMLEGGCEIEYSLTR
jgi:hypothetical protein